MKNDLPGTSKGALAGPEGTPTPDEIVKALLVLHDGIKERGFNESSRWSAMRELHDTIRQLYRVPKMPDLAAVISELECIDSRLIEIVEMAGRCPQSDRSREDIIDIAQETMLK